MVITSKENSKVKLWTSLKLKKNRDKLGLFVIEGDHLVSVALEKGLIIDLIVLEDKYNFDNTYVVTKDIMDKISNQDNGSNIIGICKILDESLKEGNTLILDNVQDPGNLGTIIRSAVAFDFKNIILGDGTVDIYNDKVIRSSEGMIFNINFKKSNIFDIVDSLKKDGYKIVGTDVNGGIKIKDINKEKIAIIIGNEGKGMNKNIDCDYLVNIPMDNKCESLNAGVCASILMYEVYNG